MKKSISVSLAVILSTMASAAEFKDNFSKAPRTDSEKLGYAIWGDAAILKCISYDAKKGNKAPGSMKFDGAKLKTGEKASGFLVKQIPVTAGQKYNLMFKVSKKNLAPDSRIVARISVSDKKNKYIPDSMRQSSLDAAKFEDDIWKTVILSVDIPAKGKYADAGSVTILFGVSPLKKGTAHFDEIEFFSEEK